MSKTLEQLNKQKKKQELSRLDAISSVKKLFSNLKDREKDVLSRRYGLSGKSKETLDKIGKSHNLTRERVRQIEAASLAKLRKISGLEEYLKDIKEVVSELLVEHGGLMKQEYLLNVLIVALKELGDKNISNFEYQEKFKNNADFLISKLLEEDIKKVKNSQHFLESYTVKDLEFSKFDKLIKEATEKVRSMRKTVKTTELLNILKDLEAFKEEEKAIQILNQSDLKNIFSDESFPEEAETINQNKSLYSFLQSIKYFDQNKFGEWGMSDWREIKPKTINDKIYLVLKHKGRPMHFTEIADRINEVSFDKKKANSATVHNELILDDRYELVGRGLYALKAWR